MMNQGVLVMEEKRITMSRSKKSKSINKNKKKKPINKSRRKKKFQIY